MVTMMMMTMMRRRGVFWAEKRRSRGAGGRVGGWVDDVVFGFSFPPKGGEVSGRGWDLIERKTLYASSGKVVCRKQNVDLGWFGSLFG